MRSYAQPLLLWFTRGQGRITAAGVTQGYGVHNAVWIPAGTMHGFEASAQVFGSAVFLPAALGESLPSDPVHLRLREAPRQMELTGLIDALARELQSDAPGHDRAAALHAGLLAVWLERQIAAPSPPGSEARSPAARRLVAAFTALVEADYHSGRGVSHYARALGVTPTHLSRACRECSGRPASKILADRVAFEARRLLIETDLPVGEIGRRLGFRSAAYFTRAFHRVAGRSPSDFRKAG
ncbi:MAG: AraC family transcriptional regulator [Rhodobacteraceae bacterium]|nr:AraC family transcriptional regulator [Paracoccaceae bacterium]